MVTVETTGEVEAKNSVKIYGPQKLRAARVWNIKIADLVEEGTVVRKGDYVGQLDRTEVEEALKNAQLDIEDRELDLIQSKIDTALTLQQARNNLENSKSEMLDAKLEVEKSIYEPPVIIAQAEAKYEKARRNLKQAQDEYQLKLTKAIANVREMEIKVQKDQQYVDILQTVLTELRILAPEDGMVIYSKDRRGTKTMKGSMLNTWEMIVAELPDLSTLITKTYVNEVDIRKIAVGQPVEVTFDAFPEKSMTGKVIAVANVGETIAGSKAKVFEVAIEIEGTDADIKPAMTTGNTIVTAAYDDAMYLPIETVYTQGDTVSYVYLSKKFTISKQEVITGERNNLDIIITAGLEKGDQVLYLPPENNEDIELIHLPKGIE